MLEIYSYGKNKVKSCPDSLIYYTKSKNKILLESFEFCFSIYQKHEMPLWVHELISKRITNTYLNSSYKKFFFQV